MINDFLNEINKYRDDARAEHSLRFFKTGKGEYGEGDLFLGITVPDVRLVAKKFYKDITPEQFCKLIKNPYHEIRLCALLMFVFKYEKGDFEERKKVFELYSKNVSYVNNWDLVDLTAPKIIGHYAYHYGSSNDLRRFADSENLWSQRVSIVAAHYFIRNNEFEYICEICEHFLNHKHDLIHKAAGWMLREAGKKDAAVLKRFLDKNAQFMPRTMLRYAIEKFPPEERKKYLQVRKVDKL